MVPDPGVRKIKLHGTIKQIFSQTREAASLNIVGRAGLSGPNNA
jgi:hypothetical protein